MKKPRLLMKFFLDEGVPVSVGKALEAAGHQVIYFGQAAVARGAADDLVCLAATLNEAILVAHDGDMKTLAKGHGVTPARFKTLSLIKMNCRESASAMRMAAALSLIEHEWVRGEGRERRLFVVIGDDMIRTHR